MNWWLMNLTLVEFITLIHNFTLLFFVTPLSPLCYWRSLDMSSVGHSALHYIARCAKKENMYINTFKSLFLGKNSKMWKLRMIFNRPTLGVASAEVSLKISWRYPQIASIENCARHYLKSKCTLKNVTFFLDKIIFALVGYE